MYDPLTVAFDLRFLVIWHRDPEEGDLCYGPYRERGRKGLNPRWHYWHWDFQVPIIQAFKRWVWTECAECGEGFKWQERPCSHQYEGKPARWFRGEEKVYHYRCLRKADQVRVVGRPRSDCLKDLG